MSEQAQQPIIITLSLSVPQVNLVLQGLGQLPTSTGAWPLTQMIVQQANAQLPEPPQEDNQEEASE